MRKFDAGTLPPAPDLYFETGLWESGLRLVAGVDEAGRGALAGPVAAGVLVLPPEKEIGRRLEGMRDSKKLSPTARAAFCGTLHEMALAYAVGFASPQQIDLLGILAATRLAVRNALSHLTLDPEHLLVDYLALPDCNIPQTSIVKGDERSLSIAGASILAKVARDDLMRRIDSLYPAYGFAAHKGYGTQAHRQMIARLGLCPIHRRSFRLAAD